MKKHLIYWLAAIVVLATGCQKELSFEGSNSPAKGSLQSDITGDCLPKTVNGTYVVGTALVPATNTITVSVNVTKTGSYTVYTDTMNGFFFRATGNFTTLGANNVTLRSSNGTPFAVGSGVTNFVVFFDTTFCDIQVPILPAGSGPATFTLVSGGTPTNCASAVVAGTYVQNAAVNASNYVDVTVNVATIGTYTITATGGGMTFQATGTFSTATTQTVRLLATGTPSTLGANTITFATPFASCSFTVTVVAGAAYTINCPGSMANGTYQVGTPLDASNTITISITVATAGPYSLIASINGMTFSNSGTLTLTTTTITLNPTLPGTPANAGTFNLLVGTPTCSIPIICTPAPNWSFRIGTTTYYQGNTFSAAFDPSFPPPFTVFSYEGDNVALDDIIFDFIDLTGGITANETYNTRSQGLTNIATFYFVDGAFTLDLGADPLDTSVGIIFTVTSHNAATKTITGTFTGTAFDFISNTIINITNGTFNISY